MNMNYYAARAIASLGVSLGSAGIAWAAPNAAVLVVIGMACAIFCIWANS